MQCSAFRLQHSRNRLTNLAMTTSAGIRAHTTTAYCSVRRTVQLVMSLRREHRVFDVVREKDSPQIPHTAWKTIIHIFSLKMDGKLKFLAELKNVHAYNCAIIFLKLVVGLCRQMYAWKLVYFRSQEKKGAASQWRHGYNYMPNHV